MFDALKRWISRQPTDAEWGEILRWAKSQKRSFKRVREEGGFVIDGNLEGRPWRLEWGPPQRQYIQGHELRLRLDAGLSPDLQMLVLSRDLFETLERATFDSFTETTQTVMDSNSPEEMRWLVMFPAAAFQAPKSVRSRFHLVGDSPLEAANWFEGALASQLDQALEGLLKDAPPFMIMVMRGRVYLRLQLAEPNPEALSQAVAVFECAVRQAMRTNAALQGQSPEWPQSEASPTAWQTQFGPEGPGQRPR